MTDDLIRGLVAGSELSAEEIMDVLWLAAIRQPQEGGTTAAGDGEEAGSPAGTVSGQLTSQAPDDDTGPAAGQEPGDQVPLRLDDEQAGGDGEQVPATRVGFGSPKPISDPIGLSRVLRPLKRIRTPAPRVEIDVDATIEATADAERLTIVTTRPLERALDLALVVDGISSMRIWDDTFDEFERVLTRTGAFRTVSRWRIMVTPEGLRLADPHGVPHPPRRLVDPSGRRLVFVATTAADRSWYADALWDALAVWSASMPTAIIQMLPPHYWPATAIGEPYVTARARRPASPNSEYVQRLAWWATDPGGHVLPVLTLSPDALGTWAQAAVSGTAWVGGVTATPPDPEYIPEGADERDPVTLVNDFLALASPGSERLARVLAGAGTLSMPLIAVLQERLAPETGVPELAEILASGLLVQRDPAAQATQPLLRFQRGVREILQRGATAFEEWDSYRAVSEYLSERHALGGPLHALVPDPSGSASVNVAGDPFAALEQSLAIRLGIRPAPAEPTTTQEPQEPQEPEPIQVPGESPVPGTAPPAPPPPASSVAAVNAVAVSPDGAWLVSGGADGVLRVWDYRTRRLLRALTGHTGAVHAVAVSPDGTWLVSGDADGVLRTWESQTWLARQVLTAHEAAIYAVAVSPDGRWLVSGGADWSLRVREPGTGRAWGSLTAHEPAVYAVAVSPDGRWLVSGGADEVLRMWEPETLRLLRALTGYKGAVLAVAVSPDGGWLVSGGADGTLRVWESQAGSLLRVLTGHSGAVHAVAVSPDGSRLVSGGADGKLQVWDLATGRNLSSVSASEAETTAASDATTSASAATDELPLPDVLPALSIEVAVEVDRSPGLVRVRVLSSPAGEASVVVRLDAQALQDRARRLHGAPISSSLDRPGPDERPFRDLGQTLFTALLGTGEIAGVYRASAAAAAERGDRMRIMVFTGSADLAALPWEAMYDGQTGVYVCRRNPLVRRIPVPTPAPPLAVRPPLRILGIISTPTDLSPIDADQERDVLMRALADPVNQGLAEVTWVQSATWREFRAALLDGEWHVIHFIGHGAFDAERGESRLALTHSDGPTDWVEAARFADLLREARPVPRLVVLNSSDTAAAAAPLVRAGVSAVVTMQYTISDSAALAFSRGFYTALAHGRSVDDAVSAGRASIVETSSRTMEWITPVLYVQGGDTRLFQPGFRPDLGDRPPP